MNHRLQKNLTGSLERKLKGNHIKKTKDRGLRDPMAWETFQ